MTDDPVVVWLRGALDHIEQVAREADGEAWTLYSTEFDPTEGIKVWGRAYRDVAELKEHDDGVHIALHDPRAVLARVEAERALLAHLLDQEAAAWTMSEYGDPWVARYAVDAVRLLAWGHRHDAPGYDPAWAPEGVSADA